MAALNKSEKKVLVELHQAVTLNNLEKVEKMLKDTGTKINFDLLLEDMSETVLTEAVKGGDMRVIELLVEHGASTTTHNFSGKGPMHLAGFIGNNRAVSTLLSYKAPVDTTDNSGRTALHWAVRKHHHTTDLLLKKGADVNKPNKDGVQPLHDAATAGDVKIIQLLIDNKADVMALTEKGESTAYMAVKGGHLDALKLLLKHGADPSIETKTNETIMHIAAASGQLPVVEYLVDTYNYDVNFLNKKTSGGVCKIQGKPLPSGGWTAFHFACAGGHAPVVKYLLKAGVNWKIRSDEEIAPKDLIKIFKHTDTLMPLFPSAAAEKKDWKNF